MTPPVNNFIMLPTVDFCFKELMQNAKVRKGFIASLLHCSPLEIAETSLLPTILTGTSEDSKTGILDVHVLLSDGAQIDIEMQVRYFAYWAERVLYYLCRMYSSQLQKGQSYKHLQKCIHVSILNFIQFLEDQICYRSFHLAEDFNGRHYSDKLEIQVLELPKLPLNLQSGKDILSWMRFLNGKNRKEFEDMAKTNEYISEAYQELLHLSADQKKKLEYEAREKALKDYNTQISWAKQEGLSQGLADGKQITRQVFKLFMSGKSPEEISVLCHLSIEEVEELLS